MLQNNGEFAMLAAAWLAIVRRENASCTPPEFGVTYPQKPQGHRGGRTLMLLGGLLPSLPVSPMPVVRVPLCSRRWIRGWNEGLFKICCLREGQSFSFSRWSTVWRRQRHCCYCPHEWWKVTAEPAEAPGGSWRAAPEWTNSREGGGGGGGCCRQGVHK